MSRRTEPKWIPISEARVISGRRTDKALTRFVENWNYANLDHLILRIPGYVDENTLRQALNILAERHTPGMDVRRAITDRTARGSVRATRNAR